MEETAGPREFEEAFPRLFLGAYHVTLRLLGDVAQAEDAAAEALARAFVSCRRVGELEHREAWVLRVATNVAIDQIRHRDRRDRRDRRGQALWPVAAQAADNAEEATCGWRWAQPCRRCPRGNGR